MKRVMLALSVFLATATPARSGLDEGIAAYKRLDFTAAYREFLPVARQGDATAQYYLGIMYDDGKDVDQDFAQAAHWYRLAAEQGVALAQLSLGVLYFHGRGVAPDYAEAARWYRKAAELGNASAQNELGAMYEKGHGVTQNPVEAVKWYRISAEHGDVKAQYKLGFMYHSGDGPLARNSVQAYMWYSLAAANAPPGEAREHSAYRRDEVARGMTPAQLARAQELARDFKSRTSAPAR